LEYQKSDQQGKNQCDGGIDSASGWALTNFNFDRILCIQIRAFKNYFRYQTALITHVVKNSPLIRINS
jgi:hypothetical protein